MKKRIKEPAPVEQSRFHLIPEDYSQTLPPLPPNHYWLRISYDSSRRKTIIEEPTIDVDRFKHADSHIRWELERNLTYTSPRELLKEFRKHWPWYSRKPCAWVRNPEKNGLPIYGSDRDVIVVVYPRNFRIIIDRNDMFGPHPARLYYHSYQAPDQIAWVAICQIEGMWHSDERLLKALNSEIRRKQFYHSNETANSLVIE